MTEEKDLLLVRSEDVRIKLSPVERTVLSEVCKREGLTSSEAIGHLLVMYDLNFGNNPNATLPEWEPFKPIPQPPQPVGKQRRRGGY